MVGAFAERVLVETGRAAGVRGASGATPPAAEPRARVTVRAPRVVVAAGALESPALLLRSGIGGPATGQHLYLHPSSATLGDYGEDMQAWWGAPQSGLINEFADTGDGYGFLIEGVQYTTGLGASASPWTGGAQHKAALVDFRDGAVFVGLIRDHGHGRVTIDEHGSAVPWYEMTDPVDLRNIAHAVEVQVRAHVAAGARRVRVLAQGSPEWRVGRRPRGLHRARAADPGAGRRPAHVRRPPDGLVPHGPRPQDERRQAAAASCTTRPACGSATRLRSRPPRGPTR